MGILCLNFGFSQQKNITGTITEAETGDPLPGVNIMVKGTKTGTISDIDGKYSISVNDSDFLVISFIGYVTQVVEVGDKIEINVKLDAEYAALEEVVVFGYGTVHKSCMTGAVSSVSFSESKSSIRGTRSYRSDRSISSALSGKVPGVVSSESHKSEDMVYSEPKISAGILTAGELHDFSKWNLWTDVNETYLTQYQTIWGMKPLHRFMVQVIFNNGLPVIDCQVELLSSSGEKIWKARTDNTGKAELWNNFFYTDYDSINSKIVVNWEDKTYIIEKPSEFPSGQNCITIKDECEVPDLLEAVFVVDATGSMGDEISYLKEELKYVINKVEKTHTEMKINMGAVFYRDEGDAYVTKKSDLSENKSRTYDFINKQDGDGGGDGPEAVDQALDVAINDMNWSENARARLIFLILDAPPHQYPDVIKKIQVDTEEAAAKGIKIIPVACSGIDKSTEYLLRSMALATNGTYLFLTDHSGVGGTHLKPTTDKYDVNLFNNLLLKVFYQYTYASSCDFKPTVLFEKDNINLEVIATVVLDSMDIENELKIKTDSTQNQSSEDIEEENQDEDDNEDIMSHYMNLNSNKRMKVYPNPTSGLLNIETKDKITEVYLADISGKLLERFEFDDANLHQIQLGQFATGIYFIRYQKEDAWLAEKIVLVRE